ncbi:MAG: PaaI family thioesterase [Oscillospiraceae bacterium]|jgi:acyl-CoA thioesterase|nr:PaaI family thioesterase [Oscillospiraceae bacterium]
MKSLDEIRAIFASDLFAAEHGITIDEVTPERTVCSVTVQPRHMNAMGRVQGGLVFTLADFAFAVATNYELLDTVTLNSTIHFVSAPGGGRLTATAVRRHGGRSVGLYDIDVTDDQNRLVARVSSTSYRKQTAANRG